ncbi:MAG: thiamine-phosphate kinase [Elusimicrobia bacterium]|nr:thiamine-phosphate kinase [Elusimicrobiota bacterium]
MNEADIISFIGNKFAAKNKNIIVGFGDDTFCFKSGGKVLAVTKDMLVENTHFKTAWSTPFEIGYKAVNVNISDLASMGSVMPLYILVGLGIPKNTKQSYIKGIATGIQKACKEYGCIVAGGDTVRAEKITISVTAVGECLSSPITRRGAKAGDLIFVTGTLGDSAAGLQLLQDNKKSGHKYLLSRHKAPKARLKEGAAIAKCNPSAMMDISDGLHESLKIMSATNNLGFSITAERLPLSKEFLKYCKINKIDPYALAISGGEDFELLFTISKANAKPLQAAIKGITCIGEVIKDEDIRYLFNGKETKVKHTGFNHF